MKFTDCIKLSLLIAFYHPTNVNSQENNADIIQIRKLVNEINRKDHLTKLELDAEEFLKEIPDGGASLTGYFDNDKLVKIRSWIGLSFGIRQIDYYFLQDTLIFAFASERHFKVIKDSLDLGHTMLAQEIRYYFRHEKLVERKVNGSGFWDKEQETNLLPESKSYFVLLRKKKNAS